MPETVDLAAMKQAADHRTRTYTQAACVARGGHCYDGRTTCKHCGHSITAGGAEHDDYPDW